MMSGDPVRGLRCRTPASATLRWVMGLAMLLAAGPLAQEARAADAIEWGSTVPWLPFDTAVARAKAEGKAIGVVVYADWCPKCRSLAPAFMSGPVVAASSKVLWVLQNHDEQPAWLQERFASYGNYVPRIFFLRPDGTMDAEIQSGHARFPYFYLAAKPEALIASIDRAALAGGPAQAAPPQPPVATAAAATAPGGTAAGSTAAVASAASASSPGWLSENGPLLLIAGLAIAAAIWAVRTGSEKA